MNRNCAISMLDSIFSCSSFVFFFNSNGSWWIFFLSSCAFECDTLACLDLFSKKNEKKIHFHLNGKGFFSFHFNFFFVFELLALVRMVLFNLHFPCCRNTNTNKIAAQRVKKHSFTHTDRRIRLYNRIAIGKSKGNMWSEQAKEEAKQKRNKYTQEN